jgi:hypothetical protein
MVAQGNLFAQDTFSFPTTVGTFEVPREVVDRRQVPDLMNLLHEAIADGHSREAFVNRSVERLELTSSEPLFAALGNLFDSMQKLDREGKNRVWTKLIRNRYASLFFRHYFDFVVGNPPHVNWESLTPEWRKAAEKEYRHYGLFTLKGLDSRHGGSKKDIAALFTYAVMDHFVKDGGVLALVGHVSLFKTTGAGEGFRRFQLGDGEFFRIDSAHDFSAFQPFQTEARTKIKTRTLTFRAAKGRKTEYPIPFTVWEKSVKGFIPGNLTWQEAQSRLQKVHKEANPLRGTAKQGVLSPWLTLPPAAYPQYRRVIAPAHYSPCYEGHAGFFTGGLNGVYFLDVKQRFPNGTVLVRNMHDVGKIKCPETTATIEADLVYPLLRGRSVARWRSEPMGYVLMVQDPERRKGYDVQWMQRTHPLTWAYLRKFERLLRKREAFKKFFDPGKDPFYSMYDVGPYTFAPHKVVWMDVSATMKATVVTATPGNSMPLPEHKLLFLTAASAEEAHYVAAVLNSEPVGTVISGYSVDNSVSTHPIENIKIPKFDPANRVHQLLAELSREAHQRAQADESGLTDIEERIDEAVQQLWR